MPHTVLVGTNAMDDWNVGLRKDRPKMARYPLSIGL